MVFGHFAGCSCMRHALHFVLFSKVGADTVHGDEGLHPLQMRLQFFLSD